MEESIAVSYIIYAVKSKHAWFNTVSYPIMKDTYHLVLFQFHPQLETIEVMGTKNSYNTYVLKQEELMQRVQSIITYQIYNN